MSVTNTVEREVYNGTQITSVKGRSLLPFFSNLSVIMQSHCDIQSGGHLPLFLNDLLFMIDLFTLIIQNPFKEKIVT